jgi:hypothetical protein
MEPRVLTSKAWVGSKAPFAGSKRPVPWWPELNLQRQVVGSVIAKVSFAWGKQLVPWWPEFNLQRQVASSVIAKVWFAWGKRPVPWWSIELAKASICSVCRKQTTGCVMTGVELRHTEGPRVASDLRHLEDPRVASYLFAWCKLR